jgi:hypothetical protein
MARSTPARLYLLAYNTLQLAGWSLALAQTLVALRSSSSPAPARGLWWGSPSSSPHSVYAAAAPAVRACQAGAILETLHVVLGRSMK